MKYKATILIVSLFAGFVIKTGAQNATLYTCYDVDSSGSINNERNVPFTDSDISSNEGLVELINQQCDEEFDFDYDSDADQCGEMEQILKDAGYTSAEYLLCTDGDTITFCLIDNQNFDLSSIKLNNECRIPDEEDDPEEVTTEDPEEKEAQYTCYFAGATKIYSEDFFSQEILTNNECNENTSASCGDGDLCQGNQYVQGEEYYCCVVDEVVEEPEGFKATDSNTGCDKVGEEDKEACLNCMYDGDRDNEPTGAIWTALGCIDPSPGGIVTRIYQIGVGIAGGLIILLKVPQIVIGYNSGNPEKIKEAQEGIWMVIGGLFLLLFATVILQMIGVNVISLPEGFI